MFFGMLYNSNMSDVCICDVKKYINHVSAIQRHYKHKENTDEKDTDIDTELADAKCNRTNHSNVLPSEW